MTWVICQTFTRALESLKVETLTGSLYPREKMYELEIYRGVIYHDNEKWCKISRGIDLRNLTNFGPSTRKSKKFPH